MESTCVDTETERKVARLVREMARAASGVLGRNLIVCEDAYVEHATERVAAGGGVHISFRFTVVDGESERQGCVLVPYEQAVTMAGALLMLPVQVICENRMLDAPDETMREALIQLGSALADGLARPIRALTYGRGRVRPAGCQGVRAGRPPVLEHTPGEELVVASVDACFSDFEPFEMVLLLPPV